MLEINLLPSEFKHKKIDLSWLSDSRVIWSTLAMLVLIVVMAGAYFHVVDTIDSLEKEVQETKQKVEKERPLLKKIDELEAKKKEIAQKSNALRSIQVNKKRWVVLFESLSTTLKPNPNTWIMGITQNGDQMNMSCATWNFSEVAQYMLDLEKAAGVTKVVLANINAAKIDGEDAYNFSLNVDFDQNLGLESTGAAAAPAPATETAGAKGTKGAK
jgi:type IV pilus assembly protein PilN